MNHQELRIGNLVYQGEAYGVVAINPYQIYQLAIMQSGGSVADYYGDFEPVVLTERWLLRLGFKPLSKDYQKNNVIIHSRRRGFVLRKSVPVIRYVHQLQNLYFALTGSELETKSSTSS